MSLKSLKFEIVFSYQNTLGFDVMIHRGEEDWLIPSCFLCRNGLMSWQVMGTALGHSMVIIKFTFNYLILRVSFLYNWHKLGQVLAEHFSGIYYFCPRGHKLFKTWHGHRYREL